MFLLFWGGYIELVLSFIWYLLYIFPPGQKCGEDLLSMTLCHRHGVGKLTVDVHKGQVPVGMRRTIAHKLDILSRRNTDKNWK